MKFLAQNIQIVNLVPVSALVSRASYELLTYV